MKELKIQLAHRQQESSWGGRAANEWAGDLASPFFKNRKDLALEITGQKAEIGKLRPKIDVLRAENAQQKLKYKPTWTKGL